MGSFAISVIIPSYKPGDYFWKCLDSLQNQTLDKSLFEVILVLNGCDEPWKSEIERYIIQHLLKLNIQLLHTDVAGVSNARNIGLDMARGDYISFIDDDDYISPSYLEELLSLSDCETVALSYELAFYDGTTDYFPYNVTKDYNKYVGCGKIPFYKARRLFNGPVYKLIPRSIIGSRKFDVSFSNGEDSLFMFLISDCLNSVVFSSKNAVYYRRLRQNSATTAKRSRLDLLNNSLRMINGYIRIYISNPSDYNIRFLITRILGAIKSLFLR